jgi:hypothetical protein
MVKRRDSSANAVSVVTTGGQTIDGETSMNVGALQCLVMCSDGANWMVI